MKPEKLLLRGCQAIDFLPDDRLGELRDYFPHDLLDDLAGELGDGFVFGAAGGQGRDLLIDLIRDR